MTSGAQTPVTLGLVDHRTQPPENVLGMADLEGHLDHLIHRSLELKTAADKGQIPSLLDGKSIAIVFEQNSTRTRASLDLGVQQLGGACTILDSQTSQLARGESLEDTARVLSRYADALVYRADTHANVEQMAEHATVPVVNALTPREHPCQVLADLTTLAETWGPGTPLAHQDRTLAYVGDGNNMCHSYLTGAALAGLDVHVATPAGYGPDADVVEEARDLAQEHGAAVHVGHDPSHAVQGADAVATDTWISMGDEDEKRERLAAFEGFTVDETLMDGAGSEAVFLHCLPGHWGHEATYEVAHGPDSVILDEAENRLWTQMALLGHLVETP